jgi:hypothetical protein
MGDWMELEYEYGTPREWQVGVNELKLVGDVGDYSLQGPCPRCKHQLTHELKHEGGVGFNPGQPEPTVVLVTCNCQIAHKGAPAGKYGCGAFGGVQI